MSKSAENHRDKLVGAVEAAGEYIAENADKLVDSAELKMGFSITLTFGQDGYPEIAVEQVHAMRNVLEVLYD